MNIKRIKLFILFFLSAILISSCSVQPKSLLDNANQGQVYRSSGVERFFLPLLSQAGRISELSKCLVPEIQYFDFNELSQKYGYNYEQSLRLQVFFSQKLLGQADLSKKDYNQIFYESFEQVDSGAKTFPKVRSSQLYVIAIDGFVNFKDFDKLRRVIREELLPKAQVALLSRCNNSNGIEKLKMKQELSPQLIAIGAEYFSYYNNQLDKQYFWSVNIKSLLPNKDIIYITTTAEEKQLIQGSKKQWNFSNL